MRRTDFDNLAKRRGRFEEDEAIFEWIDSFDKNDTIYLATDNRASQDQFISRYGSRIRINKLIDPSDNLRQTTAQDTLIDIYNLVETTNFRPYGESSVSGMVTNIREALKCSQT